MLAGEGVRTVQTFGVPDEETLSVAADAEAVVVSLKSRSIPAEEAVARSLGALRALEQLGARQVQFKYCSTFDSTPEGNIGPVVSVLMDALQTDYTVAVPALPVNGRTQYMGYLFVNGTLLSESPMRYHPLNPMTESNLVRHLQAQTSRRVGLIDLHSVRNVSFERSQGVEIALVDAIDDTDLRSIATAVADDPLITGGSGISQALPAVWKKKGLWERSAPEVCGTRRTVRRTLMLSGSCSTATLRQVGQWHGPSVRMNPAELGPREFNRLIDFCLASWEHNPEVLVYSSAEPGARTEGAAKAVEAAFAEIARTLLGRYEQVVTTGGETSGAVIEALGVRAVEIGPRIDPGIPALRSIAGPRLVLALKSGNFGSDNFFAKATQSLLSV